MENNKPQHTPLYRYAGTIKRNWENIDRSAKPYIDAMFNLDQITDTQEARSVVVQFLHTSTKWRGDMAREVKRELKRITNCKVD